MFKTSMAGQKWTIAKIIISFFYLVAAGYLIYCGVNYIMLNNNQKSIREITPSDYDSLVEGEMVTGTINSIVAECYSSSDTVGTEVSSYLLKADNDKFIIFRTESGTEFDAKMRAVLNGSGEALRFRGNVNTLALTGRRDTDMYVTFSKILGQDGMDMSSDTEIITQCVDVNAYDAQVDGRVIFGAFALAAIMLFLVCVLMRKTVKDMVYSFRLSRGKITPEVNLTPDEPLEIEKNYDGGANDEGFFYVGYNENDENKEKDDNTDSL